MCEPDLTEDALGQSLLYALDVWRNARSPLGEDAFPSTAFRVPTASGWIPADEAFFGRGWAGEDEWLDDTLVRLLDATEDVEDLRDLAQTVVLRPEAWLGDGSQRDAMREFLERAGVRHGLWPVDVSPAPWKPTGAALNDPASIDPSTLPDWVPIEIRRAWLHTAATQPRTKANYLYVDYALTRITELPGQFAWSTLPTHARELYGELLLAGLDRWDADHLHARFFRRESHDTSAWPSFVTAFLASEAWFPQREPSDRARVTLVEVADAWWVSEELPSYLPTAATHLRRSIGSTAVERLRRLGLRHWDAPDSAADRIDYLAALIAAEGTWIRGTRADYERSWEAYLSNRDVDPSTRRLMGVLVERAGAVELIELSEDGEPVYYAVPDLPQAALLAYLPLPRLGFTERRLSRRVGDFLAGSVSARFRSVANAEIEVVHPDPTTTGPVLDVVGDWLETVVHLVLSHQQGVARRTSRQLEQAAHRLRATRLTLVDSFSTRVDGHEVEDSRRQAACFVEREDGTGVVLVRGRSEEGRIKLAELAAEGIGQAIGAPDAFRDLRLALIDLQAAVRGGTPSNADVAEALRLPLFEVELASVERSALRPDLSVLVTVLATIAPDLAEDLRDGGVSDDRPDLEAWLDERLGDAPPDAKTLLSYADSGRVWGPIEDGLVSLRAANDGLRLLGLEPISNADAHTRGFTAFVAGQRSFLRNELRDRFVERVTRDPELLAVYAELIDLRGLAPDPSWSEKFWQVPRESVTTRAEAWLLEVAGPPDPQDLPSVDELRGRRHVTSSLTTARDSVITWCDINGVMPPAAIDVAVVTAQIRASGFLDFGERAPEDIVGWLYEHGLWPQSMPRTLGQRDLGITPEDLKRARDRKRQEAEDEKRRAAAITYGEQTFTGEPDDLLQLDQAIAAQVAAVDLGQSPGLSVLNELPPRPSRGGTSGGAKKPARATPVPPEKTQSIGLAGELFAGHWIESNFGLPREETWCSGYRNDIVGDGLGSDSLGYDFKVLAGDVTYLIEVKAATRDDLAFSLPESEIRRAVDLAPHERYTILFVANVLDDDLRRFLWLPNPLGPDAGLFRVDGRQMQFRFDIAD